MADKKISQLDDGGVFQADDAILIARDGDNFRITGAQVPNVALVANTVDRVNAIETEVTGLAAVARTGSYTDLLDKPATDRLTIPSARVWRVYLLPTQDSDQRIYSLSTLAPFGTDGADLRPTVVAIMASSHLIQDLQPVSNLIDDSATSVWSSNDGAFTITQWIEFEFSQPVAVAQFGFAPRNDSLNLFVRDGYVVTKDTPTSPEVRLSNFSFARGSAQADTLLRKPTLTLVGLPAGGVQGQVLQKNSGALGDAIWVDAPTGGDTSGLQADIEAVDARVAALAPVARTGSYTDLTDKPAAVDITALQNEINATQTGAGLQSDGSYSANSAANYLKDATSLKDADSRLDTALKQVSNQIAALGSGGGSSNDVTALIPSARFWRVYFLKTTITTSLYVQLTSLIPFAADGTDLRSSVVAITASSHANASERPVSNLIDANFDTLWSSNDRANFEPQWVQFEFADPVKITNFGFSVRIAYPELFPGVGYFVAKQTADGVEQALARFEFESATVPVYSVLAYKPTLTNVSFPLGGKPGQVLSKTSPAHGDATWVNLDNEESFVGARFWRVYLTVAPDRTQVGLSFFGLGGLERVDTPVVASSSENAGIWPPGHVRPNWSGSWFSAVSTDPMPWIEYQFDRPVTATELTLVFDHAASLPTGFRLECRVEDTSEPIVVLMETSQTFSLNVSYEFPIKAEDFRPRYTKEALIDGTSYVRKNATWAPLVFPTPANSGVVAGTYSNPTLTVDAKGRVTSALNGASATSNYRGTWSLGFDYVTYDFDAQTLPSQFSFDRPGHSFATLADNGHSYVLKFPYIPFSSSTVLTIPFTAVPGFDTVSVRYRTSSEFSDYGRGFVDGVRFFERGGISSFETATRTSITPGTHTLTISYTTDSGIAQGDDTIYISEITIPTAATGKVYAYGDTVVHEGSLWFCIKAASVDEPGTSADWLPFLKEPLTRAIPPTPRIRGAWGQPSPVQRSFTFAYRSLPATWTLSQGTAAFVDDADQGRTAFRFPPTLDNAVTTLTIPFFAEPGANTVTVRYATDSEQSYDKLIGRIDGVQFFEGSGEKTAYAEATTSVVAGRHMLTLSYAKDGSASRGQDTAYISVVTMPAPSEATAYHYGDFVTSAGKLWLCGTEDTMTVPGTANSFDWLEYTLGESQTGSGGGSGGGLFPIKPPTTAQLAFSAGQTTTITAGSTFTTFMRGDGISGGQSGAFYGLDVPTTETWTMDAVFKMSFYNPSSTIIHGLSMLSSDGSYHIWGYDYGGSPQFTVTKLNSLSSYNANIRSVGIVRQDYQMFRIAKTLSSYQFYSTPDFGNTWMMFHEVQSASLSAVTHIGVHNQCYNTYTLNAMVVPYFNVSVLGGGSGGSGGSGGGSALTPYNYREGAGYNASLSNPLSMYLPSDRTVTAIVWRMYRGDGVTFDDYPYEVAGKSLNDFFQWSNQGTGGRVGGRITFQILANGSVAVSITSTGGNLMWLEDGPNFVDRFDDMFVLNHYQSA